MSGWKTLLTCHVTPLPSFTHDHDASGVPRGAIVWGARRSNGALPPRELMPSIHIPLNTSYKIPLNNR